MIISQWLKEFGWTKFVESQFKSTFNFRLVCPWESYDRLLMVFAVLCNKFCFNILPCWRRKRMFVWRGFRLTGIPMSDHSSIYDVPALTILYFIFFKANIWPVPLKYESMKNSPAPYQICFYFWTVVNLGIGCVNCISSSTVNILLMYRLFLLISSYIQISFRIAR